MSSAPLDEKFEAKARRLRVFFRDHKPAARWTANNKLIIDQVEQDKYWRAVKAEYERLFGEPSRNGAAERIVASAWKEKREVDGQRYDYNRQCWVRADGSRIVDDE